MYIYIYTYIYIIYIYTCIYIYIYIYIYNSCYIGLFFTTSCHIFGPLTDLVSAIKNFA